MPTGKIEHVPTYFSHYLAELVTEYYKDPEHRRQFEERYFKKHGKPYEWKTALKGGR